MNWLCGGNDGNCLRNAIYILGANCDYIFCDIGYSIQLDLMQKYELNTLKIWLWDGDYRFSTIKVFIKLENTETLIYDSNLAQSIVTITFPDQIVGSFRIYNTAGNTRNTGLYLIKVEAYYKFQ
ncbi:unnamed protein product [Paramecium primaurelia]|uniref:Uncharacterized protein n=1 Tax=Paramecium primaurelia TaxID=5886 RepID=A0A8S1NA29_PARPR|nr:unnamed protein product [Paramecium primaurelia]